ncbi:la-related protein 6-like [Dendronephthya gigantea]|uniref:la-related protein 6-like n=1 Tax=Dendronephthya gigantea TaxID=151771 RepID=UPI0010691B50|nr:la-related protein 6-like [Dendronephthya gigantea]
MADLKQKSEVLSEIQPPSVIITPADSSHVSSSTSEDENDNHYIASNGSFIESHSENEFTKASKSPFQPPSDELKEKIRGQVEFYMSDENLTKDAFLLKHVRRHKEGFVNLKLITSFKKVKNITKDYRVVAESIKDSELLVINAEGTKIRRKKALPAELVERNPGRTVVARNLPSDDPSVEKVAEIFSKYGPISVVRIVRNGKNVPPECKQHFSSHPELAKEVCAIVEFETMAASARACAELKHSGGDMKVNELLRGPSKNTKAKNDKENRPDTGDSDHPKDPDEGKSGKRRRKKKTPKRDKRLDELVKVSGDEGHTSSSDNENNYSSFSSYKKRFSSSPDGHSPRLRRANQRASPGVSSSSPVTSPEMRRRNPDAPWRQSPGYSSDNSSPSRSPVVQRRFTSQSPLAANADHKMTQSLGVLRQPKGPDGTRGFTTAGRGRMVGVSA